MLQISPYAQQIFQQKTGKDKKLSQNPQEAQKQISQEFGKDAATIFSKAAKDGKIGVLDMHDTMAATQSQQKADHTLDPNNGRCWSQLQNIIDGLGKGESTTVNIDGTVYDVSALIYRGNKYSVPRETVIANFAAVRADDKHMDKQTKEAEEAVKKDHAELKPSKTIKADSKVSDEVFTFSKEVKKGKMAKVEIKQPNGKSKYLVIDKKNGFLARSTHMRSYRQAEQIGFKCNLQKLGMEVDWNANNTDSLKAFAESDYGENIPKDIREKLLKGEKINFHEYLSVLNLAEDLASPQAA